jgi:hypothetical protein
MNEVELIQEIILKDPEEEFGKSLVIKILEEKSDGTLIIVITNSLFDPFLGMYSSPRSWEDFDNDIITRLKNKGKFELLPGNIYEGEVPEHFRTAVEKYEMSEVKHIIIRENESIPGFPMRHDNRIIHFVRLQMLDKVTFQKVEANFNKISQEIKDNKIFYFSDFTLTLVDDTWWEPIYELSASWHPEINHSSNNSLKLCTEQVLAIFNSIMPSIENNTVKSGNLSLRNTLEILSGPGEIYFDKFLKNEES